MRTAPSQPTTSTNTFMGGYPFEPLRRGAPDTRISHRPCLQSREIPMTFRPSFLFDLDGTLVDSVYEHVLAWQEALTAEGIELSVWRIHRKIGMSGGLFTNQLLRETGVEINPERVDRLRRRHAEAFLRHAVEIRPLPGACDLMAALSGAGIRWAIATSG